MVRVALVGYTNVGKSTLMNLLSKSDVFAENKLFATLDTTVRKVTINNLPFLLSDTVGFIRKLPHTLVDAFRSTLEEALYADLLVVVSDLSSPNYAQQRQTVFEVLNDLGAADRPILEARNKADKARITGMIEPYVFQKDRSALFCYTGFLRPGGACVRGFFPSGTGEDRWYDYITDETRLTALEKEYHTMLTAASPFLKTYPAPLGGEFRKLCMENTGTRDYLLSALPVFTMPPELLSRMLSRAGLTGERKAEVLAVYGDLRRCFVETLKTEQVNLLLSPVEGSKRANFSLDLMDLSVEYTQSEYAEHIAAVMELVENERNFHLTLLPAVPFRDIEIVTLQDAVAVLRCREPYAAFLFTNPTLTRSVSDYLDMLIRQYVTERRATVGALERLKSECAGDG